MLSLPFYVSSYVHQAMELIVGSQNDQVGIFHMEINLELNTWICQIAPCTTKFTPLNTISQNAVRSTSPCISNLMNEQKLLAHWYPTYSFLWQKVSIVCYSKVRLSWLEVKLLTWSLLFYTAVYRWRQKLATVNSIHIPE